jgi:predicted RNA binding protein YcfA (HicA-like mRNA interferase family)
VPRLNCTYREFIAILLAHSFIEIRQEGSHRQYRGTVNGQICLVTVAAHDLGANIGLTVLQSMIRQSGLKGKLFRK